MNEATLGVFCGMTSGLDRHGSGLAPNVNSAEDIAGCWEDVTSRPGWTRGKRLRMSAKTCDHFKISWFSWARNTHNCYHVVKDESKSK